MLVNDATLNPKPYGIKGSGFSPGKGSGVGAAWGFPRSEFIFLGALGLGATR